MAFLEFEGKQVYYEMHGEGEPLLILNGIMMSTASWKAFIPVLNTYNNYKISWDGKLFFLYAVLFIASTVLGAFAEGAMGVVSAIISLAILVLAARQDG